MATLGTSHFTVINLTYSSPANKSIGSSTTEILAANTKRLYVAIVNDSNEVIYLAFGVDAVMNKGIRLNANGGTFEAIGLNMTQQAVDGICSSGSKNVTVQEAT